MCSICGISRRRHIQGHQKRVETIQQLPDNVGEAAIATDSTRLSSNSTYEAVNHIPCPDPAHKRVRSRKKRVGTSHHQLNDARNGVESTSSVQGRARSCEKHVETSQKPSENTHNAVDHTPYSHSAQGRGKPRQKRIGTSQKPSENTHNAESPSLLQSAQERVRSHQKRVETSQQILNDARKAAIDQRPPYSSESTREAISTVFYERTNGLKPYEWQLDVAEALILGLDCLLIAGTGAGKSMPFVMPLFILPDKMVIIISPLNALEEDQAVRFAKMGMKAIVVNGDTYSKVIHQKLEKHQYNVVLTSPEMCLSHPEFRRLLNSTTFAKRILALVIDEAHCITQWGDNFRKDYAVLGTLRAFVPARVPILATSATLPPVVLAQVQKILHMDSELTFYIHQGTDRPNIAWFVRHMKAAKSDLDSLSFLLPLDENGVLQPLKQSLVFFDNIKLSLDAFSWFQERLPTSMQGLVATYNSRRSTNSKHIVLDDFQQGRVKILLTTEAAGMGCDMPHIEQVVQFLVPSSLSVWMQRAGRAGRNPNLNARAILLVQPTVFQVVKPKNSDAPSPQDGSAVGEVKYRKDVEEGLRGWVEGLECRREMFAIFFNDGVPRKEPTGDCCDNCMHRLSISHELLHPCSSREEIKSEPNELDISSTVVSMSRKRSATGVTKVEEVELGLTGPKLRRPGEFRQGAVDVLTAWRHETYKMLYLERPWNMFCLLPDDVIDTLSSKRTIKSVQDLIGEGWSPTHANKHGQEVLKVLANYDAGYFNKLEVAKENKGVKRSRGTSKSNANTVLRDSALLNGLSQSPYSVSLPPQSPQFISQPLFPQSLVSIPVSAWSLPMSPASQPQGLVSSPSTISPVQPLASSPVSWPLPMSPPVAQPQGLVSQSPPASSPLVQYPPGYYGYNGFYYCYPMHQPQVPTHPLYHQQYPYSYLLSQSQNQSLLPAFKPGDQ